MNETALQLQWLHDLQSNCIVRRVPADQRRFVIDCNDVHPVDSKLIALAPDLRDALREVVSLSLHSYAPNDAGVIRACQRAAQLLELLREPTSSTR